MTPAVKSLLCTLCYSDLFDFPLTQTEIYDKLITSTPMSLDKISTEIESLVKIGQIQQTDTYYYLPKREALVELRHQRQHYSLLKMQKATTIANNLIKLPYVAAIFITGTVAVGNASKEDDIDLMIVTQPHSLWTARLFVTLWLELHGLRRRPFQRYAKDLVCANLYVATDDLAVHNRNLYTAHEVIQVKPLADPAHLYERFLGENRWITTYLGNVKIPILKERVLETRAPGWLEHMFYKVQLWYMSQRKTREDISVSHAYFHPKDLATSIISLYNTKVAKYGT